MSERITSAGYEQASADSRQANERQSTQRATAVEAVSRDRARAYPAMLPGEFEYHTNQYIDIQITNGLRSASKYLNDMDIDPVDRKKIRNSASDILAKAAQEQSPDENKAISIARHDHVYERAMESDQYGLALRAQAGLDRVTGTNDASDGSEAVTLGILNVMKKVYKDAEDSGSTE